MWSVIATSAGGVHSVCRPPAALVRNKRLAAERLERLDQRRHRVGVAALVIMAAALKQRDPPALQLADHQPALVAGDGGLRKAGNVGVGNRDRVLRLVGERPEAGAEHEGERRQRAYAACGERGDGIVHGSASAVRAPVLIPRNRAVKNGACAAGKKPCRLCARRQRDSADERRRQCAGAEDRRAGGAAAGARHADRPRGDGRAARRRTCAGAVHGVERPRPRVLWTYLFNGPFDSLDAFAADVEAKAKASDPLLFRRARQPRRPPGRLSEPDAHRSREPRHRDRRHHVHAAVARHGRLDGGAISVRQICVRRPRLSPLRVEMQLPQCAVEARGRCASDSRSRACSVST